MKRLLLFLFVFVNLERAYAQAMDGDDVEEQSIEVVLGIDKIQTIDFTPYTRLKVGNPSILNYQIIPQKREIVFQGLKPGQTSVIVRNTVGDVKAKFMVQVSSNSQSQVISELRDFLDDVEGLEINIKGGRVVVEGEIVVPDDIGRVFVVLEKYPDVMKLYEISSQTKRVVAKKMEEEFKRMGLKNVTVRVVNKVFWLEGVVPSNDQRELALRVAEGYIPQYNLESLAGQASRVQRASNRSIIQNFITVNKAKQKPPPPPKLVKIIAQFVELSKDYRKTFGFKWTPTLAAGGGSISFGKTTTDGVTSTSDGTFSGVVSNLIPQLSSAKSAGYARILQSGMVITKENEMAKIEKSSSVPFTLGDNEFQRPMNLNTGFNLSVRSRILEEEKLELGVGLSVKIGTGSNGSTDNKIQTTLIVKSKESAVVGGININESQTQYDRDPPRGPDQVDPQTGFPFFSFVRSKSYILNKGQFVVFITPEIIDSASASSAEIKRKFRQSKGN